MPRSRRASRSMTRTAVNGSPASAIDRRRDGRVGQPGRGRAQRTEADGRGRDVGHGVSRGRSSPTSSLGIAESTARPRGRSSPIASAPNHANEPSPSRYRIPTQCVMLRPTGQSARWTAAQCGPSERPPDTSKMPTMDPEPIPTEPTTDPEPPDATSLATGPSLASDVTGGRPWTRLDDPSCGHRARARADVQRRDRGRTSGAARFGRRRDDDPGPHLRHRPTSGSSAKPGTPSTRSTSAPTSSTTGDLIYGAINGMTEAVGDTGHTSFMTPEERAARSNDLSGKYVGIGVRIDTAEDGLPLIIGVFKGSPAEKAGLVAGDEIVAVDGKTTTGKRDRRDRRLGPRRGRLDGQGDGQDRRERRRPRDVSHGPRRRGRRAGLVDARPRARRPR